MATIFLVKQYRVLELANVHFHKPTEFEFGSEYEKFPDAFDTEAEAINAIVEKGATFDQHVIQPVYVKLDESFVSEDAEVIQKMIVNEEPKVSY